MPDFKLSIQIYLFGLQVIWILDNFKGSPFQSFPCYTWENEKWEWSLKNAEHIHALWELVKVDSHLAIRQVCCQCRPPSWEEPFWGPSPLPKHCVWFPSPRRIAVGSACVQVSEKKHVEVSRHSQQRMHWRAQALKRISKPNNQIPRKTIS